MKFKKSVLRILMLLAMNLMVVGYVFCQEAQELLRLKSKMRDQSLVEIVDYIDRTGQWPRVVSEQARVQLSQKEQRYQEEAFSLAEGLLGKIREFEDQHKNVNLTSLMETTDTYARLGKALRSSRGYGNLVLTETVYSLALVRLGFYLKNNPDKYEDVESLWRKLARPFYDVSVIMEICEDELGRVDATRQLEKYLTPGRVLMVCLSEKAKEGYQEDSLEMGKVRYTMVNILAHRLATWRMHNTDVFFEISIPGLVEFLRRGGNIKDLPMYIQDVRPYNEFMGGYEKKLLAAFVGEAGPRPSHIYLFPFDSVSKFRESRTYRGLYDMLE